MKKRMLFSLLTAAVLLGLTTPAFAFTLNISFSDGYLSVFDVMTLAAIGLFLLGFLFICLALFAGGKEKTPKPAKTPETKGEHIAPASETGNIIEMTEDPAQEETATPAEETAPAETPEETEQNAPVPEENTPDEDSAEEVPAEAEADASGASADETPAPAEASAGTCDITLTGINSKDIFTFSLAPGGSYAVGRKADNDICLPDTIVSGRHCTFLYADDALVIRDEGSTNGTKVNGRKIVGRQLLHTGDVISIGRREYRIGL